MFDVGFLEIVIVGIIALLVLGPERLPVAARTAGKWVARARRMVSQFTKEIDRQVELDELRAELKKQGESLNINEDVNKIHSTISEALQRAKEFEPMPRDQADKPFVIPESAVNSHNAPDNTDRTQTNTIPPSSKESKSTEQK